MLRWLGGVDVTIKLRPARSSQAFSG